MKTYATGWALASQHRLVNGSDRRATLQSVQRAFTVLDFLATSSEPVTLTAVATGAGLERTVANRILRTLLVEGFVERVTDRYQLGPRALLYGYAYHDQLPLSAAALPFMMEFVKGYPDRRLLAAVNVPVGNRIVIIDRAWHPDIRLDLVFALGSHLSMEDSAVGRAILAALPTIEVDALIGPQRRRALASHLAEIRETRVDFREGPGGEQGIGAAILNRRGTPIGGIAVAGLDIRDQIDPQSALSEHLRSAADRLGRIVG